MRFVGVDQIPPFEDSTEIMTIKPDSGGAFFALLVT